MGQSGSSWRTSLSLPTGNDSANDCASRLPARAYGVRFSCAGFQRTGPIVSIGPSGTSYDRPVRRASRQPPGARPVAFLNARLKAASES
jgi:hypothetical protein